MPCQLKTVTARVEQQLLAYQLMKKKRCQHGFFKKFKKLNPPSISLSEVSQFSFEKRICYVQQIVNLWSKNKDFLIEKIYKQLIQLLLIKNEFIFNFTIVYLQRMIMILKLLKLNILWSSSWKLDVLWIRSWKLMLHHP